MALEMLVIGALLLAGLFLGLREQRLRRPAKVAKALKGVLERLDRLEATTAELPGHDFFAEVEERVVSLEEKSGGSAPVALKVVVDRVNQLSLDATALKTAYDDLKNRFTKLEQGAAWRKVVKGEAPHG